MSVSASVRRVYWWGIWESHLMTWMGSMTKLFIRCLQRVSAKCKRVGSPWCSRTLTRFEFWHGSRERRLFMKCYTRS
jgi:hypothetical protein